MESQYYIPKGVDFDDTYQPAHDDLLMPPGSKLNILQRAK
jgi:hypothetical protein